VNAVSTGQVNVPVVVRDDTGVQIATDTITLAANPRQATQRRPIDNEFMGERGISRYC
jgi:hypothetical protein